MNKRPIDRIKKSNIKCEHCKYWNKTKECEDWMGVFLGYMCTKKNQSRYYWNRCKEFEWKEEQ